MNKFLALASIALLAAAGSAQAVETDITVSAESKYLDRGVVLVDDVVGRADLRFNDLLVDGLFADVGVVTLDTTPDSLNLQTEVGVGYTVDAPVDVTLGVYHVFSSARYADSSVTEARAIAGYDMTDNFRVYGQAAQIIGADALNDTYFAVGTTLAVTDRFTVGARAAGYHYRESVNNTEFNNAEVTASYDMGKGLTAYGLYSDGGKDRFGSDIDNQFVAGLSFTF